MCTRVYLAFEPFPQTFLAQHPFNEAFCPSVARTKMDAAHEVADHTPESSPEPRAVWYAEACPKPEFCNSKAWKRAKAWSYGGERRIAPLIFEHLRTEQCHLDEGEFNEDEARLISEGTVVKMYMEKPRKKQKTDGKTVEELVAAEVARQTNSASSGMVTASGAASSFNTAIREHSDVTVQLRMTEVAALVDTVARAEQSAKHAMTLAQGAATAFDEERKILASARETLQGLVSAAQFRSNR